MSLTTNKVIEIEQARREELLKILEEHDCQLGPDSGCVCLLIQEELNPLPLQEDEPF